MHDLSCLLDSIALFSPTRTFQTDQLSLKVVEALAMGIQGLQASVPVRVSDIRILCEVICALASYYGCRDLQLHPTLKGTCAAEILQADHPCNVSLGRGLFNMDGSSYPLKKLELTRSNQDDIVKECLRGICRIISCSVVHTPIAVYLLQQRDMVVMIMAGEEQGSPDCGHHP